MQTALWNVKRPRTLYSVDGDELGYFVNEKYLAEVTLQQEPTDSFSFEYSLAYRRQRIIDAHAASWTDPQTNVTITQNQWHNAWIVRAGVQYGRINYDSYLEDGAYTRLFLDANLNIASTNSHWRQLRWENKQAWTLPWRGNFVSNFKLVGIDTDTYQDVYYFGGFQHVRGYFDGQWRGDRYWQLNLEYRVPSYHSRWAVLQHNFFIDAGQASYKESFVRKTENIVSSAGIGARFISPKISRFVGRMDIILLSSAKAQRIVSIGVQQFF
jgi:outer membrane protein assembly factor BamA